jgi:hypothetical protein
MKVPVLVVLIGLFLAACSTPEQKAPDVASIATTSGSAATTPTTTSEESRPRHRVDESKEDSQRIIAPWTACMKEHGADMDQQPHTIKGAEEWSAQHKDAGIACHGKLPLLPWGMDRENPAYRDNIHRWVQCMTDKGLSIVETPDDKESPWHFGNGNQPADSAKIEQDCEVATLGPSDK